MPYKLFTITSKLLKLRKNLGKKITCRHCGVEFKIDDAATQPKIRGSNKIMHRYCALKLGIIDRTLLEDQSINA